MVICHSYVSLPEGKECLQSTYDHDPSKNASWHWQQLKTDTQHGFRPERSTSHSIYVIRRIQDFAEAKGTQLSLALLDGEKAFDKVQHDRLIFALKKMEFSQHYCDIISFKIVSGNLYNYFFFGKRCGAGSSQIKHQSSVRQGCPVSPYLFVIVMSCVDHEIRAKTSRWAHKGRIPNLNFDMDHYADDTNLFSTDNRALNELLKLTDTISGKYGLRLNRNKCVVI